MRLLHELLQCVLYVAGVSGDHAVQSAWVLGDVYVDGPNGDYGRVVGSPASLQTRVEGVRRADTDTHHRPTDVTQYEK